MTWAEETIKVIVEIESSISILEKKLKEIKLNCNHAYSSGASAIKKRDISGHDIGGYETEHYCEACKKVF